MYIHVSDDRFELIDDGFNKEFIILDNTRFTDEQMAQWYGNLDCYVFPSSGEGWSMTPRESIHAGVPTIISHIPAHRELLDSGFYKCIHPRGKTDSYHEILQRSCGQWDDFSSDDIASAITDVMDNYPLYSSKAGECRLWIQHRSTVDHMAQNIHQILALYRHHPKVYSPKITYLADRFSERLAFFFKRLAEKRLTEYPGSSYRLFSRVAKRNLAKVLTMLPQDLSNTLRRISEKKVRHIPGVIARLPGRLITRSLNFVRKRKTAKVQTKKKASEFSNIHTEKFSFTVYDEFENLNMNPTVLPYKTEQSDYIMLTRNETNIEDPLNSTTHHILSYLDGNFEIVRQYPVTLHINNENEFISRDRNGLSEDCFILEDVRFIENSQVRNSSVLLYGVAMHEFKPKYRTKAALIELDLSKQTFYFQKFLEIKEHVRIEKNWIIYQDGSEYYVIYKLGPPLTIYKVVGDFDDFVLHKVIPYQMPASITRLRLFDERCPYHLSALVDAGDHYLLLFHYIIRSRGKRKYFHSGISLEKSTLEIQSRYITPLFAEIRFNIVFTMSGMKRGNSYFFFCGIDDKKTALVRYAESEVIDMLVPCEPDEPITGIEYYNEGSHNDKWIAQEIFDYKKNGYFVEAGARDGITGSSTYTLEKHLAWTGLLVEPTDDFHRCILNRPASVCKNIVLSGENGYDIFVYSNASPSSGIKRNLLFMEQEYQRRTNGRYSKNEYRTSLGIHSEKLVETLTLERLLDEVNAPQTIDFLALNVEGSEYDVLSKFNFDAYKIQAIAVEDNLCNELLRSKGFIQVENCHNVDHKWEQYFLHQELYEKLKLEG